LHAWCEPHRSDSVARSTPTAQQERPNKTFINTVLMHHPKSGIERRFFTLCQ